MTDQQEDQKAPSQASDETLTRIRELLYGGDKLALEAQLEQLEADLAEERDANERRHASLESRVDDLAARIDSEKVGRRDLADLLGGIARRLSGDHK